MHWTKDEDRVLRHATRAEVDERGMVMRRSAWQRIATEVSKASGNRRTRGACKARATLNRWCAPQRIQKPRGSGYARPVEVRAVPVPLITSPSESAFSGLMRQVVTRIVTEEIAPAMQDVIGTTLPQMVKAEVERQLTELFK